MDDAAYAITNGFREAGFITGIRGMCWFHVKQSIKFLINNFTKGQSPLDPRILK